MNSNIKYRPEIDGLRALAVISVISYHGDFYFANGAQLLKGGFFGVDIFFVISGYLITLILQKEINTSTFSLKNFYIKRIKRILPALFFVLIATLPFAYFLLLPQEMVEFLNSFLSSIFFYSNFQFWSEDPYWATESKLKPLLHTWSLAVEEQFYLFFPILLLIANKLIKKNLYILFIFLLVLSLVLTFIFSEKYSDTVFYLLPFRVWQLMSGSILALIQLKGKNKSSYLVSSVLTLLGFCGLIFTFIFIGEDTTDLNLKAIIPIISTSLIIRYACYSSFTIKLLSGKLLVSIGKISYSLYLWHNPVFAFAKASNLELSVLNKFYLIIIILCLSIISYFCIEKPFRYNKDNSKLKVATLLVIVIFSSYLFIGYLTSGYSNRFSNLVDLYGKAEPSNRILQVETWKHFRSKKNFTNKTFQRVLILGDSHGKDLFNIFHLNPELYIGFDFLRLNYDFSNKIESRCFANNKRIIQRLLNSKSYLNANFIFVSDSFIHKKHINCLKSFLEQIYATDKHIFVFGVQSFSKPNEFVNSKLVDYLDYISKTDYFVNLFYNSLSMDSLTIADISILSDNLMSSQEAGFVKYKLIDRRVSLINSLILNLANKYNFLFIDKYNYLCDLKKKYCPVFTEDGKKIYFDSSHLTEAGAKYMGQRLHLMQLFDKYS